MLLHPGAGQSTAPAVPCTGAPFPGGRRLIHAHAVRRLTTGQRERIHAQLDEHEKDHGRNDSSSSGLVAGSALAASALIFEALQVAGTAVVFVIVQRYTETSSPAEVRTVNGPWQAKLFIHSKMAEDVQTSQRRASSCRG